MRAVRLWSGALVMALAAAAPAAATAWVATPKNFTSVFARARGGDTVTLVGQFGATTLNNRDFGSAGLRVNAWGASFSDSFALKNVDNIAIRGGRYGSATRPMRLTKAIAVFGGSNIEFSMPQVIGNGGGQGLAADSTDGIRATGGSFSGMKLGIGFTNVTDGLMAANRLVNVSSDGMNLAGGSDIEVSGNSCLGTKPFLGAHPDCVQMWSLDGRPRIRDITVTGNSISGATQGITLFNASVGGENIRITDNRIDTSYPQGIACYNCDNSLIAGNVLTTQPGALYRTSLNAFGDNLQIIGNSVSAKPAAARLARVALPMAEVTLAASAVPEAGTWAMLVIGFALGGALARRRRALLSYTGAIGYKSGIEAL